MLDVIYDIDSLPIYLQSNKKQKKHIFYDIETLTINKKTEKPSELNSREYIVSVSYLYKNKVRFFYVKDLDTFLKLFFDIETTASVELTGHFIFGYDNHFLLQALKRLGYTPTNMVRDGINVPYYINNEAEFPVECLRVKRKSSLSLRFAIENIDFVTIDTYMKSNSSLATMGKKLLNLNLIDEEYLKLDDFEYNRYDSEDDMNELQLKAHCEEAYKSLEQRQLQYCRNDVVILALYYYHYKALYPGYKYNLMTLSQNIMGDYATSNLATLQLKNIFYEMDVSEMSYKERNKYAIHVKYSDYVFNGINVYTYLKSNYSGGLVMYNDKYVAKIIDTKMKYVDRNSSYPHVMARYKVPTYLTDFGNDVSLIDLLDIETFSVFRMEIDVFNRMVLDIESHFLRCAIVKYLYKGKDDITLNTNNLRLLNDFGVDLKRYNCIDFIKFECRRFDSYKKIEEFYGIKQQAKNEFKLDLTDVENIIVTGEKMDKLPSTDEEIYIAKVSTNGLSGLPALRPTFPIYLLSENGEIEGHQSGFTNKERNCIFSIFTTSFAFYHLLSPLKTLTGGEIDKNVFYTDTDSLIVSEEIYPKLHMKIDSNSLGAWDVEYDVKKLYIANNKMYSFVTQKDKIIVKSCGINRDLFSPDKNNDMKKLDFDSFIDKYFRVGCELPNTKHVINKYGTISLYNAKTVIKSPVYLLPEQIYSFVKEVRENIKNEVQKKIRDGGFDDGIFIEYDFGVMSIQECLPDTFDSNGKLPIQKLKRLHELAKLRMEMKK